MFVLQPESAELPAGLSVWVTLESPQCQQQQAGQPAGDHRAAAEPHGAGEAVSTEQTRSVMLHPLFCL